tara:strand:+ start:1097 stop:3589 length:2493 start_codon:yes stop_codon:yes gene_type:complete
MTKIFKFFLVTLFLFFCVFSQAQNIIAPQGYILKDVELLGEYNIDKKTALQLMDLSIGQKISSQEVGSGLKKLWEQDLFADIQISKVITPNDEIILKLYLKPSLRLLRFAFNGIKKGDEDNLRDKINLNAGMTVNDNLIKVSQQKIEEYFIEKGFLQASCEVQTIPDSINNRKVTLEFNITKNPRLKIKEINFSGNQSLKEAKLRKVMKKTRQTGLRYLLSSSKLIEEEYQQDLINVINLYKQFGYRDASIVNEVVSITEDDKLIIDIEISEGNQYFFGEISWLGNTKYNSEELTKILGIQSGEVFDETLLDERLNMSRNQDDVSALYMDDGYLFFQVNPIETSIDDYNMIDLEMQIREGKQAIIKNIFVKGNTKTNDNVLMREVRSLPGSLFKRSDIIRTQEEFNRLGFFNPEALGVNPIPDPQTGNVDIEYIVEEKPADQIELSGGYGGESYGFVGQLAVSFNNFSTKGIFDKTTWSPLPTGDGQKIQLSAQAYGRRYQNYTLLFQEPWLGGKKPNAFTTSIFYSVSRPDITSETIEDDPPRKLNRSGFSLGLGKRLKWPDDYFTTNLSLNISDYDVTNWPNLFSTFNINIAGVLSRSSVFNPIYPRRGSKFLLSAELTPPYSLFSGIDKDEYIDMPEEDKFELLEYYKIKTRGEWYTELVSKLVLKTSFEFGFLSAYNDAVGIPPYERFEVGGDGISGYSYNGSERIGVRGYPNETGSGNEGGSGLISGVGNEGQPLYSKYTAEFRYPISLAATTTIYALCFAEAANAWEGFDTFNPFEVKRSLGVGIRIFMPMFGLMGVDFGYGFDPLYNGQKPGLVTSFTIGQQF